MARDYNAAIAALNTLQSNFAIVDQIRKSGKSMNQQAIPEMIEWCSRIGYTPSDFNKIDMIHVAGTKGKGSTSAFISSILSQYNGHSPKLRKIGLYTSPHLRSVRERIRINNEPISEELFAKYFFEVWDRLEQSARDRGLAAGANGSTEKPVYFRYLTLVMFHLYLSEGVDTAVIECGIGGEYDSTNVIEKPSVSAVTSLDIDHVAVLGKTIEEIAWHKAGIFKKGSRCRQAFTVTQPGGAPEVLASRAADKSLDLVTVPRHPQIEDGSVPIGLDADFQKVNASLAVAVSAAHLRTLGVEVATDLIPDEVKAGLKLTQWGGRCETRHEGNITWYIDGGHTLESIRLAANWFSESISNRSSTDLHKVLFFNQQTRDATALARQLHTTLSGSVPASASIESAQKLFDEAVFSTNITFDSANSEGAYKADLVSINTSSSDVSALTVQRALADVWKQLDPAATVRVHATIQAGIQAVRSQAASLPDKKVAVFVTGSLHLVGGVLEVLESSPASSAP